MPLHGGGLELNHGGPPLMITGTTRMTPGATVCRFRGAAMIGLKAITYLRPFEEQT